MRKNIFGVMGEMASKLRTSFFVNFSMSSYNLDTTKVDYSLTKSLYYNTADKYKLGSAFIKPIVDVIVGFCGLPTVVSVDENAQAYLNDYLEENSSKFTTAMKNFLRDGDVYMRFYNIRESDKVLYPEQATHIRSYLIPPGWVTTVKDKDDIEKYIINTPVKYYDENKNLVEYNIVETITPATISKHYVGNVPPGKVDEEKANQWGFIPIVHFKNSDEPDEVNGRSEIENVEPYIRAYHDVLLQAIQSNKLHSTPKIKLRLTDAKAFLKKNFTAEQLANAEKGDGLKFDKDLYLLDTDEDIDFVEIKSATGDAKPLLKLLFFCIVDASETPEFAFGTAVSSSKASVGEQLIPLEKKINMKRSLLETYFRKVFRILLAIRGKTDTKLLSVKDYRVKFVWDDVSPKNEESTANVLKTVVDALSEAVDAQIISVESAVDYLSELVPNMSKFNEEEGEKSKIIDGQSFREAVQRGLADILKEKQAQEK